MNERVQAPSFTGEGGKRAGQMAEAIHPWDAAVSQQAAKQEGEELGAGGEA